MRKIVEFPDTSLIEEEACQWIVQFEDVEEPGHEEVEKLHAWMNRSPRHRSILLEYAKLWDEMGILSELKVNSGQVRGSRDFFVEKIRLGLLSKVMSMLAFIVRAETWLGRIPVGVRAAFVLLPIALLVGWQVHMHSGTEENLQKNVYITGVGETSNLTLSDGSTFWLNTDSEVSVEYTELKRRIVLRKGEAHFQVAEDAERPFEVYAGSRMVRAVGTAFSVYKETDQIRVTVTEGKVDLAVVRQKQVSRPVADSGETVAPSQAAGLEESYSLEETAEVIGSLQAGEIIVLSDAGEDMPILPVVHQERQDLARRLSWREGQLVFAGESLEEVVREVNRYTRVQIEIVDPEIRNIRVGGQFQVGETEALFDVLQSGFGVKVTRLDDQHVQIHALQ